MSTALAEPTTDTTTHEQTTTGPGSVKHVVPKVKSLEAYVFGSPVTALCGVVFVPTKDPQALPVCQPCKAIYEDDDAINEASRRLREESQ